MPPFLAMAKLAPSTESLATMVFPFSTVTTSEPYGAPAAFGRIGSNEKLLVTVYVNVPLTTVAATTSLGRLVETESLRTNAGFGTVVPFAAAQAEQI